MYQHESIFIQLFIVGGFMKGLTLKARTEVFRQERHVKTKRL